MNSINLFKKDANKKKDQVCNILVILSLVLIATAYIGWLIKTDSIRYLSMVLSILFSLFLAFVFVREIPHLVDSFYGITGLSDPFPDIARFKHQTDHTIWYIVFISIGTRLLYLAFVYFLSTGRYGYHGGLIDLLKPVLGTGTNEYLSVAESHSFFSSPYGYFPLFPLLVFLLNFVVHSFYVSGTIVSFIFFILCTVLIYSICLKYYGKATSLFAAILFCVLPTNYVLNLPLPFGMLLFFVLMTIWYLQKKKYYPAILFSFLAILTNPLGILCILLIGFELGSEICVRLKKSKWEKIKEEYLPYILLLIALLLPYIAFRLFSGSAKSYFSFCSGRETHVTFVYSNISSLVSGFIYSIRRHYTIQVLLPYVWNFIMILLPFLISLLTYRNVPACLTLYGLALSVLTVNTTDTSLLSFYLLYNLSCLFGIAGSLKKTWLRILIGILSFVLSIVILIIFIWKGGTLS